MQFSKATLILTSNAIFLFVFVVAPVVPVVIPVSVNTDYITPAVSIVLDRQDCG